MNLKLTVGLILLFPVLIAAVAGPNIAPYDKNHSEGVRYEDTERGREIVAPPSPPSEEYLLGTNKGGKDLLSLILYGARWTVAVTFILAAIKIILGSLIGLSAVFKKKQHIKMFNASPLNSLPQIVFLYFVLARISLNFPFNEMILIIIFGIVITVFGTPACAASIEATGKELAEKEFYTAAVCSGAGRFYLLRHHILPFLKEKILTLFVNEIISVLNILGQMGIFGIFLGATVMTFDPRTYNSRLHEWAGLVGQARFNIFNDQWILLGPLGAYVLFLVSLYFIHEGLKIKFRENYRVR